MIALSSAEAEYVALSECAKAVSWLRRLYWEVAQQQRWSQDASLVATSVAVDSTAAIAIAENAKVSARNKHIDIKCHHVQELLAAGVIYLYHVRSEDQPADILTKIVPIATLQRLVSLLCLRSD